MRDALEVYGSYSPEPSIVSGGSTMERVTAMATRVAASDAKVLITGESGVGKDVLARYIHAKSHRATRAFVAINCAGLTETLLESELFGHVKGSFTGAHRDKIGKLQLAHRGTVFLDEIGEMSLRMQALLLRFLENGEVQPVGADSAPAKVDVRVVAATNRDLSDLVAKGTFREDLLYRIRVVHIQVPPLRDRRDDIRMLVAHAIERSGRRLEVHEDALRLLERYRWPGNIRELNNVVEQLLSFVDEGDAVQPADLPPHIQASGPGAVIPARERRRQVADDLYQGLVSGAYRFWDHIHSLFMNRDITRGDMRALVRRGLIATRGNYRSMLRLFGMPDQDYKKLLNFLSAHDCAVDFREFRAASIDPAGALPPPPALPLSPPPSFPGER